VDTIARRYQQRPSALVGIDDAWLAYQVDLVVADAGIRAELDALHRRSGRASSGERRQGEADAMMLSRFTGGRVREVVSAPDDTDWWKQLF
jgi:hypothetical protein